MTGEAWWQLSVGTAAHISLAPLGEEGFGGPRHKGTLGNVFQVINYLKSYFSTRLRKKAGSQPSYAVKWAQAPKTGSIKS